MARTKQRNKFSIDPSHEALDIYSGHRGEPKGPSNQSITLDIWLDKYQNGDEEHPYDSFRRVVEGVYAKDPSKGAKWAALEAMEKALWIPAGRIQAGAGTTNRVTLLNCFMDRDIEDSMPGIAEALKDAMLTQQQGGGIGMNFSTLRPTGAYLHKTGAVASGPLPFMDMWNSMCQTIQSAGARRGAMMAVLNDEHPDLLDFITAKREAGRLTNFNMSILVSDGFMDAVKNNEDWYLGFHEPRADGKHLFVSELDDERGKWYAYSKIPARELWDTIMENTFEYSEPGVIFMDRVNDINNLGYCEVITGTNPCGEQPLPANGCCNLGAVNLARMVKSPFTTKAEFDIKLLKDIAAVGTRFLDNVIDVTRYPLPAQQDEEYAKRRIGMGVTGLANCLAQLRLTYGTPAAIKKTEEIMSILRDTVYRTSAQLAKERGAFPLYDAEQWGTNSPVVRDLPKSIKTLIKQHGVRNGVLLTIAPTGTTSIYAGNVSSGLEPVFLNTMKRNVRQADDSFQPYVTYDYGVLLHNSMYLDKELPKYFVTHEDISTDAHLKTQAACQRYIDASVSKTINCREDISLEEFKDVYSQAYELGLKGCTTYKPSDVRGSILSGLDTAGIDANGSNLLLDRPEMLEGKTYKVKWPTVGENYYITVNEFDGQPRELFIQSTSSKYTEWTTALAVLITALMRQGIDISFVPEELQKVVSAHDSNFVNGRRFDSLVALIGHVLGEHLDSSLISSDKLDALEELIESKEDEFGSIEVKGDICPDCNRPALIKLEGCFTCTECGYSKCG